VVVVGNDALVKVFAVPLTEYDHAPSAVFNARVPVAHLNTVSVGESPRWITVGHILAGIPIVIPRLHAHTRSARPVWARGTSGRGEYPLRLRRNRQPQLGRITVGDYRGDVRRTGPPDHVAMARATSTPTTASSRRRSTRPARRRTRTTASATFATLFFTTVRSSTT
jgi:hypothetical protein